jgi:hypothetical protein
VPATVAQLLSAVDAEPLGCAPWGELPDTQYSISSTFVVALTPDRDSAGDGLATAPLSEQALERLLEDCPGLQVNGRQASLAALAEQLSSWWMPGESVLYVGVAPRRLKAELRDLYETPLGAPYPYRNGWWLKLLSNPSDLWVHYALTATVDDVEAEMLRAFARDASAEAVAQLPDDGVVAPFANLRDAQWRRKEHGITGAVAASVPRADGDRPNAALALTPKDVDALRIRVPRGVAADVLPDTKGPVTVLVRGQKLTGRWNPRLDSSHGVIRLKRSAEATDLLDPGSVFELAVQRDGTVELR